VSDGQRWGGEEAHKENEDMLEQLKKLIKDEEAPTAVEYAIMVAGIAVAVVLVVYAIGDSAHGKFSTVNTKLNETTTNTP
jgi:pilus assembly protein Flp/PilA